MTLVTDADTGIVYSDGVGTSSVIGDDLNNNWSIVVTFMKAHDIGSDVQAYSADLAAIVALAKTDGNVIVGNGSTWVAESGATARTSLGLGTGNTPQFSGVTAYADQAVDSLDPTIIIRRSISTGTGNAHGFADNSDVSRTGTIGYAAYDARTSYSGSANFDHHASFQSSPTFTGSGTINDIYGTYLTGLVTAGTVTDWYGERIEPPTISGTGAVTNYFAVFLDSAGDASNNWGIYTGAITSLFGGNVYIHNTSGSAGTGQAIVFTSAGTYTPVARIRHELESNSGQLFFGVRDNASTIQEMITLTGGASPIVEVAYPMQLTTPLQHEYGGLEADVSAYSGLVKISGGSTSQAVAGTDYLTDLSQDTTPQLGGNLDTNSKTIYFTAGTYTPNAGNSNTVTIDLTTYQHPTLDCSSATGACTVTFTPPSGTACGVLELLHHATPKDITWAVTGGTIKWAGTEPTWTGDTASYYREISYRWNGTFMVLSATEEFA